VFLSKLPSFLLGFQSLLFHVLARDQPKTLIKHATEATNKATIPKHCTHPASGQTYDSYTTTLVANMPEAIATSKRKFHKLLDSITAASNTVSSTQQRDKASANASTSLTAREKMDLASDRARKRLRSSTSSASLSVTLGSSFNRTANTSTMSLPHNVPGIKTVTDSPREDKHIPNFAPWSQETFLARLKTFSKVSNWHPKPEPINEIHWAKRGWSCVDLNTVACKGGCERRVVVKLDTMGTVVKKALAGDVEDAGDDEEEEIDGVELEQALAERYKNEIVEGHTDTCLWRKAACKDDIYRLSLVRPVVWKPQVLESYTSLLGMSKSIKDLAVKSANSTDAAFLPCERLVKELPTDVIPNTDTETSLKAKALEITLHGWRGSSEFRADLLHCETCFQRIGLWMYQPGYKPGKQTDEPNENDDEEDGNAVIDLVEMHREHCPWRNAATQNATGSLAGLNACQILHRVVSTYAREQRRKSDDQRGVRDESETPGSPLAERPKPSREEIELQDKERESKLKRLKKMFTVKRSSKLGAPQQASG
jgi:hypothetical protein